MPTLLSLSDYAEQKLTDHVTGVAPWTPPAAVYLTFCSTAPTDSTPGTEASGGTYARQPLSFEAAGTTVARRAFTDDDAVFTMPAGTWTHVMVMDALTDGNMLLWGKTGDETTDVPVTTDADETLTVPAGDLSFGFADQFMTDYLAHALINHMLRSSTYSVPSGLDMALTLAGVEATGMGYAREAMTYGAWAAGQTANTNAYGWTNLPGGDYDGARLHEDAASGGQALWAWTYPTKTLAAGAPLTGAVGSSTIKLDS